MKLKVLAVAAGLPLVAMATPAHAEKAGDKIANSYICVFKKGAVSRGNVKAEANRAAQANAAQVKHVYDVVLRGFAVNAAPQAVENMQRNNANIAYCEQDQVVTAIQWQGNGLAGKGKPGGGGGSQPPQETPWGIARVGGGGAGNFKTAWVIDSGIQLDHPDLNVDVARSASFLSRGGPGDENGHGTHVAGTIAAIDNSIGVIGVAPGAPVVAVRVLDRRGSGSTSGVVAGINYVATYGQPGDVANMSLGGGISQSLDQAVVDAAAGGVRFALAAGNEGDDANNHSPARANGPNVFTISAIDINDTLASWSNYGNPPVDFAEPGVSIKSTWTGSGYNTISGTSMATPHFAGILLWHTTGSVPTDGRINGDRDGNPDYVGVVQ
ncbi:peptidase S8 and S53, subtilisin, kexin, sedolisin [Altererythrobacter epoxidivorans]|uniref:Peptidase S8 and S53, subtilisin, kexin, sedolisin n=1 Tax=Altererythrobacter epoxidivorans TaxID=361183 RepID=A0A0M3TAL6_9SPHN|nr:S8 family peptidase [Altererythrobacter epoxidivorans]ALE16976.1 peptidase S8 and S53, subtilisin, kexin, sedolisin [Altererythrobacter epoxidivorans]